MLIFGHRGAAGEAPENTIAGARHAIERGVKQVEIDLRLSADGQLVVVHDSTAKRTAGVNRQIVRMNVNQLASLDARQFGPPWPRKSGCAIPTLARYIRNTPEIQCYQLEVKSDEDTDKTLMIKKIGELFPTPASTKKIVITSFDYPLLAELRQQLPYIPLGVISYKPAALTIARDLECQYFCIHESIASSALIKKVRRTDMHISIWTVNSPEAIKNCYELQVDSIISDYPSMALPLINSLIRTS